MFSFDHNSITAPAVNNIARALTSKNNAITANKIRLVLHNSNAELAENFNVDKVIKTINVTKILDKSTLTPLMTIKPKKDKHKPKSHNKPKSKSHSKHSKHRWAKPGDVILYFNIEQMLSKPVFNAVRSIGKLAGFKVPRRLFFTQDTWTKFQDATSPTLGAIGAGIGSLMAFPGLASAPIIGSITAPPLGIGSALMVAIPLAIGIATLAAVVGAAVGGVSGLILGAIGGGALLGIPAAIGGAIAGGLLGLAVGVVVGGAIGIVAGAVIGVPVGGTLGGFTTVTVGTIIGLLGLVAEIVPPPFGQIITAGLLAIGTAIGTAGNAITLPIGAVLGFFVGGAIGIVAGAVIGGGIGVVGAAAFWGVIIGGIGALIGGLGGAIGAAIVGLISFATIAFASTFSLTSTGITASLTPLFFSMASFGVTSFFGSINPILLPTLLFTLGFFILRVLHPKEWKRYGKKSHSKTSHAKPSHHTKPKTHSGNSGQPNKKRHHHKKTKTPSLLDKANSGIRNFLNPKKPHGKHSKNTHHKKHASKAFKLA